MRKIYLCILIVLTFSACRKTEKRLIKTKYFDSYASDTSRFIAHAGGGINKLTYTNSLEALNLNYKKGFRLFELDIQQTSDNKYVATHDWKSWKSHTSYSGSTPPSLDTFLSLKIKKIYTPLDIDMINDWFYIHNDAILITDKINKPLDFSNEFNYKDRLIMELFTIDAIQKAKDNNIPYLVSQIVFKELESKKINKIQFLIDNKVEYVAISRYYIKDNLQFIKQIKELGVKVYLYNINSNAGFDETYVINYEMDYVYGIYADFWEF